MTPSDRVAWPSSRSIWETLASELLEALDDESAYDTNPAWRVMAREARRALDDGDAYGALQHLRTWVSIRKRG